SQKREEMQKKITVQTELAIEEPLLIFDHKLARLNSTFL
ncbi:unnamed protein product, partial [marine sediment metagenome]